MANKEPTLKERLAVIERILNNEVFHELKIHRWLMGLIITGFIGLLLALMIRGI